MIISERVKADVDDSIYELKVAVQLRYGLSFVQARDLVNNAIRELYEVKS